MKNKILVSEDGFATVDVNSKIYSLNTVYAAAYVFLDGAYIILDGDPKTNIKVSLKPKDGANPEKIALEFYNELLNYAKYSASVKENNEILKMIVQRALFSSDESLAQDVEDKEIEELIKELEKEDSDEEIEEIVGEIKDVGKRKGQHRNKA